MYFIILTSKSYEIPMEKFLEILLRFFFYQRYQPSHNEVIRKKNWVDKGNLYVKETFENEGVG